MTSIHKKYLENVLYPILMICGPSGVGKSTLVKSLAHINGVYELSVSYTTRKLTPEEKSTKLYRHVSEAKFISMIEKSLFAEYNHYKGSNCYYGTPWSELNRILKSDRVPALDIDINGLVNLDKQIPRDKTYRLYLDVNQSEQEKRIIKRGRVTDTPEKIASRLRIALKEKRLLEEYLLTDSELFSEVKDYNLTVPELYANQLINVLAMYLQLNTEV